MRINKTASELSVGYHPNPPGLTSRIQPHISAGSLGPYFLLEYLFSFFSNLYIARVEEYFQFYGVIFIGNSWGTLPRHVLPIRPHPTSIRYTKPLVHARAIKFIIILCTDIIIYCSNNIHQRAEPSRAASLSNLDNHNSKFNAKLLHLPPSYFFKQPPLTRPTNNPFLFFSYISPPYFISLHGYISIPAIPTDTPYSVYQPFFNSQFAHTAIPTVLTRTPFYYLNNSVNIGCV